MGALLLAEAVITPTSSATSLDRWESLQECAGASCPSAPIKMKARIWDDDGGGGGQAPQAVEVEWVFASHDYESRQ